jgi:hypothetical protein
MNWARVSEMRCCHIVREFCLGHGSLICVVVHHDSMMEMFFGPRMDGCYVTEMCWFGNGQRLTCVLTLQQQLGLLLRQHDNDGAVGL